MSSLGSEHGGTWSFVGRDVVVLHRLPDAARCPAGAAADALLRSLARTGGLRHVVDHDQPRDPVSKSVNKYMSQTYVRTRWFIWSVSRLS